MPRFRKSKRPIDISVSTPTPPSELVQHFRSLPRGDSRALAGSSAAIALSIGFAFPDICDRSGDGAAIQGRDTGWLTAYGAARMAVEAIKESSDMFLPLKAVAGAMSVLMKNYDVSMSCLQTEQLLILHTLPVPANTGKHRWCEGDRAKGAVIIRCSCLSCQRGRLRGERKESRASEVCSESYTYTSIGCSSISQET